MATFKKLTVSGSATVANAPSGSTGVARKAEVDAAQAAAAADATAKAAVAQAAATNAAAADATSKANAAKAYAVQRANHTGTQSADTITDGSTNKAYSAAEKTRLAGIENGATANDTDAHLRDRSTHTGTQLANTISDFAAAVAALLPAFSLPASIVQYVTAVPSAGDGYDIYHDFSMFPGGTAPVVGYYISATDTKEWSFRGGDTQWRFKDLMASET